MIEAVAHDDILFLGTVYKFTYLLTYNCWFICSEYMAAYESDSEGGGDDVDDDITNHLAAGI